MPLAVGRPMGGNTKAYLPNVVIGGAPRSGTTFLCEVLSKHPDVYIAQPFIPEPKVLLAEHPNDEGYEAQYRSLFDGAAAHQVRIEKTSNYFENAFARDRFARLLPNTRLLFILRDPIERAYSNWRWSTKNGLETLTFTEAIALEGERPNPFGETRVHARPFDYVTRSCYGTLAQAWCRAVGRDRLDFLMLDDAMAAPETFVAKLQDIVGVAPLPWSALKTGIINATDPAPELTDDLVASLRDRLLPEMRLLETCTGLDLGRWGFR